MRLSIDKLMSLFLKLSLKVKKLKSYDFRH